MRHGETHIGYLSKFVWWHWHRKIHEKSSVEKQNDVAGIELCAGEFYSVNLQVVSYRVLQTSDVTESMPTVCLKSQRM